MPLVAVASNDLGGDAVFRRHSYVAAPEVPRTQRPCLVGRRAEKFLCSATANSVDLIVRLGPVSIPQIVDRDWGTISYKVGMIALCPGLLVK